MSFWVNPGCLMALIGMKADYVRYSVISFRMPVHDVITRYGKSG
jgi:hypothetical protein